MARGIDVLKRSVRQKNPILVEAIHSFEQRPHESLVDPTAILRVHALPKIFPTRRALLRIQPENPEHFIGAVERLLGADVPSPTACVGQLLRFGEICLTSLELLLRQFVLDPDPG